MAIDRAWFSYENHIKTATLTADSEEAAMPVENIADRLTYRVWRTQNEVAYFRAEWAVGVEMQAFVLSFPPVRDPSSGVASSIAADDEITIKVSNVSAGASELLNVTLDSNAIRQRGYFAYVADAAVIGRYLEVSINAASRSAQGFFELSYAHVGRLFQPGINFATGSSIDFQERSLVSVTPFEGSTFAQSRARLLGFSGVWDLIRAAELPAWQEMQEQAGTTQPVAFGLTASGNLGRKAFVARFEQPLHLSFRSNGNARARVELLENR